jgi:hypothetical protein
LRFIESLSRLRRDVGGEALVCFIGSHGDALEFLKLAEEVLDQVSPLVEFSVKRQRHRAARML